LLLLLLLFLRLGVQLGGSSSSSSSSPDVDEEEPVEGALPLAGALGEDCGPELELEPEEVSTFPEEELLDPGSWFLVPVVVVEDPPLLLPPE
jgi:hypothetical protein